MKSQPDIHSLPVGVLIPTRNSISYLPRHLETMRPWLDAVQEIVVVDSASTDGTMEFLRENLPACKTRFFEHPPGLYQSWNFGIQQITTSYTYVSTVGDEMSPGGLAHLVDVAEGFACDVVISPPIFVNDAGAPVSANPWPIHEVISFWELEKETYLEGVRPYLIALSFLPFALLGSSASNLYRTRVLQKNPFPTGYGLNGDGAWGAFNLLNARLGITPRRISFFRRHEKSYLAEYETDEPEQRMLADSLKYLEKTLAARPELQAEAAALQLPEFIRLKMDYTRWRSELKRHRRHWLPWYFKPVAWRARTRRGIALEACRRLLKTASFVPPEMDLNRVGLMPAASQGTSLDAQTVRERV